MNPRIERLQRRGARTPGVIGLGGGLPAPELFPRSDLAAAFLSVVEGDAAAALQYGWPEGIFEMRAWIAERLRARGACVVADDVIMTSGAQQALALAAECLLAPGSTVAVDAESYPAALVLFRRRGAILRAAPVARPAMHYVMPGVSNPLGRAFTAAERDALLASGAPIVADEAYTELRFDGVVERSLLADARDRVWLVGTVSKTLCPGLRVGWLVPPPSARACAVAAKHDADLQAGSLAQALLERFLATDDFDARLARARSFYAARAEVLLTALRAQLPSWRFTVPEGGFAVWAETDTDGDDEKLLEVATEHGVSFDPGSTFRPSAASSPLALRVCFSCATPSQLQEGARRLARAWRAFPREPHLRCASRTPAPRSTSPTTRLPLSGTRSTPSQAK